MRSTITGSVSYRQRVALPPGSRVRVRLEDESSQDAAAVVAESELVTSGEQVPIPFVLEVDPATLDAARSVLRAEGEGLGLFNGSRSPP